MTLIMRRPNRLGGAWNGTQPDLEFQMEAFGPPVPDNARDFVPRTAESRFAQFQQQLIQHFPGGHRFIDHLPREEIADEAELDAVAAQASPTPSPAEPGHPEGESGDDRATGWDHRP